MSFEYTEYFLCPYCAEENTLSVDFSAGRRQEFVVDCEICCRPVSVHLQTRGTQIVSLDVRKENE